MTESQYLEIAIEGMKEELEKFNNQLLILEKEPENQDVINKIFKYEENLEHSKQTQIESVVHNGLFDTK